MRTETINVYKFDELNDEAKEKAREWYRDGALDYEWWDSVYEDAAAVGLLMGINVERIYFSGFASQGDGACFIGTYQYAKGSVARVKEYAPQDDELHRIVENLAVAQKPRFYGLSATINHIHHHCHEYSVAIAVFEDQDCRAIEAGVEDNEAVSEALRDFMRWIYRRLEAEHDWLMSDEQVDDTIIANEYEFTADGTIH